jgi:hypothetical protein
MRVAVLATGMALVAALATGESRIDRVRAIASTKQLAAFWDFVLRDPATGRFKAHQADGARHDYALDAFNYVREYWGEGRAAGYDDFPYSEDGPFGGAIRFREETDSTFRPVLAVPRERLHGTPLDVRGRGASVSMIVWVRRETGNHALAGIWHEGTDLAGPAGPARRVERGRRQYALFAGLAANPGAVAAHVSENGTSSFGDKYARNLAVTPEILDHRWHAAGFVFDNRRNTLTAYLDGRATPMWVEEPERHPFFRWPAQAWRQAQLRQMPGLQDGEDPQFPAEQLYQPPERRAVHRTLLASSGDETVHLEEFAFTKVRVTRRRGRAVARELAALKVNPFWFPHDLYAATHPEDGGPFTIGRVIHSSRSSGFAGWIGGVAVFHRALTAREMLRLSRGGGGGDQELRALRTQGSQRP